MAGPFVYRPPRTSVYYPQGFSYPRYHFTSWSNYPFNHDLRLPNVPPSYSGVGHPFAIPLPPAAMAPPQFQTDDRGNYRAWPTPRLRSRSVPPEYSKQQVQDPPRPRSRARDRNAAPVERSQSRLDNPWNARERNWLGEQWLQYPPRFPMQRPTDPSAFFYTRPCRWINAQNPRPDFIFDLASPEYAPRVDMNGRRVRLAEAELMQPATDPPCTRMRVVIKAIPQWPCDIVPRSTRVPRFGGTMPPVTLQDVLWSLYDHLHQRISHYDWEMLEEGMQRKVERAFAKRCRRHVDWRVERNKGVKRVDFLLKETKMVGMWWDGRRDGCEIMKLILRA